MKPSRFSLLLMLLLILLASNLMVIVSAQAISKPSVPEFTAKYVDASYDVPTTHSIDPYTGQDVTHQGYHVQNRTIQVSIKNVPFTPYESNGPIFNYYLNIRVKGFYADDWLNVYNPDNGYLIQSNASYTTEIFSLDDNYFPFWDNIPGGGTVDIQVQALIGYGHRVPPDETSEIPFYPWVFTGETSDWSSTQTVTVPSGDTTAEPTATPAATGNPAPSGALSNSTADNLQVNDLVIIVVAASAVIIAAIIAVASVLIKRVKTQTAT